jgi:hypothetical protein
MKITELKHLLDKHGPISAIWRNKDHDVPIEVTGIIGKDPEGCNYISITGSTSGIPFKEIVFHKDQLSRLRTI